MKKAPGLIDIAFDMGWDQTKHLLFTVGNNVLTSKLLKGGFTEAQKEAIHRLTGSLSRDKVVHVKVAFKNKG